MDERLETVMEGLEKGLQEAIPIVDITQLADEAWQELDEAVRYGYMSREDAEEMFFQYFNRHQ